MGGLVNSPAAVMPSCASSPASLQLSFFPGPLLSLGLPQLTQLLAEAALILWNPPIWLTALVCKLLSEHLLSLLHLSLAYLHPWTFLEVFFCVFLNPILQRGPCRPQLDHSSVSSSFHLPLLTERWAAELLSSHQLASFKGPWSWCFYKQEFVLFKLTSLWLFFFSVATLSNLTGISQIFIKKNKLF